MDGATTTFPLPLSELVCAKCRSGREGNAIRVTSYSRSFMRVPSEFGQRAYFLDIEVESVNRRYDDVAGAYVVQGTFRVRCPKCRESHPETRELVRVPLELLRELATCETCWGRCTILESKTSLISESESLDVITVEGVIKCKSCHVSRTINRNVSLPVRHMLNSYGRCTRQSRSLENRAGHESQLHVFMSYSREDEALRDRLDRHLALLKKDGVIATWHDRRIIAGTDWQGEIQENLEAADVILLLVSSDFIASSYCYDVELRRALERHDAGEACVIPIILRPVDWHGSLFGRLQALPKSGRPVTLWTDVDEAFLDIAQGIRLAAEEIRRKMTSGEPDDRVDN